MSLDNCNGGIRYAGHFSDIGWQDFVNDDEICGSVDVTSSLEAVKIKLYGEIADLYNIYYCTNVYGKGWYGWAKDGEISGTTGGHLPITAIKIMLVPKIEYSSHLADVGWQSAVAENEISGTVGEERQIEAVKICLKDTSYGNIKYSTHLEDLNWGNNVYNGKASGSTGLGLRAEALTISLDGKADEMFDVIYRVHIAKIGWMNWVKNGEVAGTVGQELRAEAYSAKIVPKGFDSGKKAFEELKSEQYNITFEPSGGNCETKTKQVTYCSFYGELPVPDKEGYIFIDWYETPDGENKITSESTFDKKSDIVLYAKWATLGDVDGDGDVSIIDATEIQKYLVQIVSFNDEQLKVADTNSDGRVDITDVTQIQKYLVGLVPSLG